MGPSTLQSPPISQDDEGDGWPGMHPRGDRRRRNDTDARLVLSLTFSGPLTRIHKIARVTVVDRRGQVLYDTCVTPTSPIKSYRTSTTGLNESHFKAGTSIPPVSFAIRF